jgi:hypothetical protein
MRRFLTLEGKKCERNLKARPPPDSMLRDGVVGQNFPNYLASATRRRAIGPECNFRAGQSAKQTVRETCRLQAVTSRSPIGATTTIGQVSKLGSASGYQKFAPIPTRQYVSVEKRSAIQSINTRSRLLRCRFGGYTTKNGYGAGCQSCRIGVSAPDSMCGPAA